MADTVPDAPPWYVYARKALIAGASLGVVALSSLVISLLPDSDGGAAVTTIEWVRLGIAVLSGVAGTTLTYKVPNDYGRVTPAQRPALVVPPVPPRPEHLGHVPPLPPDRGIRPW